jgi:hypothetical protein
MPFETATTPFTGDNDIEDFLTNVYVPFARDDCKWSDNLAPSGRAVAPEAEVYLCRQERGGSPLGPTTSPITTKPPYMFLRTTTDGNHLYHFSGTGVHGIDVAATSPLEEAFDQPGNPMNNPQSSSYTAPGAGVTISGMRCLFTNDLQGTFDKYWLFSNETGDYLHCVIKQSNRQYRHFHVGLLTPLHPDLSADSFYMTAHFWEQLDPTGISGGRSATTPPTNGEHDPYGYNDGTRRPFWNWNSGNETDAGGAIRMQAGGTWIYIPGLIPYSPSNTADGNLEWFKCAAVDEITWQEETGDNVRKSFGSVNNADDSVTFGIAQMTGGPDGMGTVLYAADQTFTSNAVPLIPFYVGVNNDFASDIRLGIVAQVPDVYRINMRDIDAEQEITIGSDTYVCFPMINKDSANVVAGEGYSAYEGYAYKKIDTGAVP